MVCQNCSSNRPVDLLDGLPKLLISHGRRVSVYFAVHQTLVLAFRVAEVDGILQSTRASRHRRTSISVEDGVRRRSIVVASSCSCVTFSSCVSWHRLRFFYRWYRRQSTADADTDNILPFVWAAYGNFVWNQWDIFTIQDVTAFFFGHAAVVLPSVLGGPKSSI